MVRGMLRKGPAVSFFAFALLLSACGPGVRAKGSAAIAGFLATTQADDRKAFEAGLDRPALRSDLGDQLAALGRSRAVDVGGASEFALDRMISPQAVRLTAARVAPNWPATPSAAQIVPHMKVAGRDHVCLEDAASRRCLLTFAQQHGSWRLVGMLFTPPPTSVPGTADPAP
jgi:hypothetical protein